MYFGGWLRTPAVMFIILFYSVPWLIKWITLYSIITLLNLQPLLPFKPQYQHVCSPHCSPYISYGASWEKLLTHQDTSSLVIISLILMTCMFDQVIMLKGEIRCLSLLGLRAVFNWVSKVIRVLLWFCFTSLCDWLKHLAPLSRPIRSKTQTNCDLLARVFPRLALVTCICFEFWLVHWIICVCCDWLG